eukprot:1942823-Rhodomonas_salina.1
MAGPGRNPSHDTRVPLQLLAAAGPGGRARGVQRACSWQCAGNACCRVCSEQGAAGEILDEHGCRLPAGKHQSASVLSLAQSGFGSDGLHVPGRAACKHEIRHDHHDYRNRAPVTETGPLESAEVYSGEQCAPQVFAERQVRFLCQDSSAAPHSKQ